jgi:hypothetical protein
MNAGEAREITKAALAEGYHHIGIRVENKSTG